MDSDAQNVTKTVSAYVRYWRSYAGLSVVEAAEASGITRQKWTEIEQGKQPVPKPDTLARVARTIGRDPAELLGMVGLAPPAATPRAPDSHRPDTTAGLEGSSDTVLTVIADSAQLVTDALEGIESRLSGRLDELAGLIRRVVGDAPEQRGTG